MRRGIPYLALSEGLDTHETIAVATGGGRATTFGLLFRLVRRLAGEVMHSASSRCTPFSAVLALTRGV